jgi:hypothetical protein
METFKATKIHVGYHPNGCRIDKTASPMNRYTQWVVSPDGQWRDPKPVCFHSLPKNGWFKADFFYWDETDTDKNK